MSNYFAKETSENSKGAFLTINGKSITYKEVHCSYSTSQKYGNERDLSSMNRAQSWTSVAPGQKNKGVYEQEVSLTLHAKFFRSVNIPDNLTVLRRGHSDLSVSQKR